MEPYIKNIRRAKLNYSLYQLSWFFVFYAFFGWTISTAVTAVRERKFIDVGFLFGPYCPSYGFGGLLFAIFLQDLHNQLFFLFLGGVIISFLLSICTGVILEHIFHRKWWDYSRKKFQFGGYVSMPYTVVWGLSAVVCISFINPFLKDVISFLPGTMGFFILMIIYCILLIDLTGTITTIITVHFRLKKVGFIEDISQSLEKTADAMGKGITGWAMKHFSKAYPNLELKKILAAKQEHERQLEAAKEKAGVFAVGCSFYKLICLFFLGAFLGDITETIFCFATTGRLMSRSSVVYGPFSIVWGLGCVLLTAILYQYRNRSDSYIFIFGTVVGGAYEYFCSVFTELVFGTVFWDYSHIPFNLGGRINLLYCFFWGIAAVVWLKLLYPFFSSLIEKIPKKPGIIITWILIIFMLFNIVMSGLALNRYHQRHTPSDGPRNSLEIFLDEHFPDERMERIYPNAIQVKTETNK